VLAIELHQCREAPSDLEMVGARDSGAVGDRIAMEHELNAASEAA